MAMRSGRRPYDFEELRLLAACVRASKFFSKIKIEAYMQQHFGMFSGAKKRVSLRFTNNPMVGMTVSVAVAVEESLKK